MKYICLGILKLQNEPCQQYGDLPHWIIHSLIVRLCHKFLNNYALCKTRCKPDQILGVTIRFRQSSHTLEIMFALVQSMPLNSKHINTYLQAQQVHTATCNVLLSFRHPQNWRLLLFSPITDMDTTWWIPIPNVWNLQIQINLYLHMYSYIIVVEALRNSQGEYVITKSWWGWL